MPPTKAASATNGGQPKLIQHDVNQSLANLANNLNLGSLGAYGVRPQSMPSQGQMGGMGAAGFMAPGGYRQPMTSNPVVRTEVGKISSGISLICFREENGILTLEPLKWDILNHEN